MCATCARSFEWRAKWSRDWDAVKYCSDQCRRQKPGTLDRRIEEVILSLVTERGKAATICPSEAARALDEDAWRDLMPRVHNASRRLSRGGRIRILKGGKAISADEMRGPVRLGTP